VANLGNIYLNINNLPPCGSISLNHNCFYMLPHGKLGKIELLLSNYEQSWKLIFWPNYAMPCCKQNIIK
jgi:hypothetical protein